LIVIKVLLISNEINLMILIDLKSFVGIAFEPALIERMNEYCCGFDEIIQQFDRLHQLGEKIQGVMSLVAAYLSALLQNQSTTGAKSDLLNIFYEKIKILVVYGPNRREACKNVASATALPFDANIIEIPLM